MWTRRNVVDAAFDPAEDAADDRVPPVRLTAEHLSLLGTEHLAVLADAWEPIDGAYADTVRAAHARAAADSRHPATTECHPLWAVENPGTLYRQLRTVDGGNARFRTPANWCTVTSHEGRDIARDRAYGVGLMHNTSTGAWLAYRATSRRTSSGEEQILVAGRTGATPAEVVDAAGFDAFDRSVIGLPTGDEDLDSRAPGWHYAAETLHVVEPTGPTGPTYLSDVQVGDRVVTTDGAEHVILTVQEAGLSRRITTCAPAYPVISAHVDTLVEARGHGGCTTCATKVPQAA